MKGLTRKQAADMAGVTIEAVRFYEREGLIAEPPRTDSGYRQYPQDAVIRVRFIKRAQSLGFSLPEIRELLTLRLDPHTTRSDIRKRSQQKIQEIDEKIDTLQKMKRTLQDITEACHGEGPLDDCPILASLDADDEPKTTKKRGKCHAT